MAMRKISEKVRTSSMPVDEVSVTTWKSEDFGFWLVISSKLIEAGANARRRYNKYRVTVLNPDNKKTTSFVWCSYRDYINGKMKMDECDILYAVAVWLEDVSSAYGQTFDEWAAESECDRSREAKRLYRELVRTGKKIDALFGAKYGPYVWGMIGYEIRKAIGEART